MFGTRKRLAALEKRVREIEWTQTRDHNDAIKERWMLNGPCAGCIHLGRSWTYKPKNPFCFMEPTCKKFDRAADDLNSAGQCKFHETAKAKKGKADA